MGLALVLCVGTQAGAVSLPPACPPVPGGTITYVDYIDTTYDGAVRQIRRPNGSDHNFYHHRPAWNSNSTYMLGIQEMGINQHTAAVSWMTLYDGNGCYLRQLYNLSDFNWRVAWDRNDPDIFYTFNASNLYRYRVSTNAAELLVNATSLGGLIQTTGPSINQDGSRIGIPIQGRKFASWDLPNMTNLRIFGPPDVSQSPPLPVNCDVTNWRYVGFGNKVAIDCRQDANAYGVGFYEDDGTFRFYNEREMGHVDTGPGGLWAYFESLGAGPKHIIGHLVDMNTGVDTDNVWTMLSGKLDNTHISWPKKRADMFIQGFFSPPFGLLPDNVPFDEIYKMTVTSPTTVTVAPIARTFAVEYDTDDVIDGVAGYFWTQPEPSIAQDGSRVAFNSNCDPGSTGVVPAGNCTRALDGDIFILFLEEPVAQALQVGPNRAYTTPCAAIAAAADGDRIEIDGVDASGNQLEYVDDFCVVTKKDLTIRGVIPGGGTPVCNSEQKRTCPHVRRSVGAMPFNQGIWRGSYTQGTVTTLTVENVEMSGAHSSGNNAQPVWPTFTSLVFRNVYFHHNDNGLLTSNELLAGADRIYEVTIENSEFAYNGGLSMAANISAQEHNIYIGMLKKLSITGTWTHDSLNGQDLKSRANESHIFYNRIGDYHSNNRIYNPLGPPDLVLTGNSNYEIDIPDGGTAYVVGNQVIQACDTGNKVMMTWGTEDDIDPSDVPSAQEAYIVNNTFVETCPTGSGTIFFWSKLFNPTVQVIKNNIWAGGGVGAKVWAAGAAQTVQTKPADNIDHTAVANANFVDALNQNYHVTNVPSGILDLAVDVPPAHGVILVPNKHYTHPTTTTVRGVQGATVDRGAFEFTATLGTLIPAPKAWTTSSSTAVIVNWPPSLSDRDITQYRVLRNGNPLATITTALTHSDTTAVLGTTYTYSVIADISGGSSLPSEGVLGTRTREVTSALASETGWQKIMGTAFNSVITPATNAKLIFYYSGAAVDTQSNRMLIWNNGQTWAGNAVFSFNFNNLTVSQLNTAQTGTCTAPPSAFVGELAEFPGRPCGRQTINNVAWAANVNKMFSFGGFIPGPGNQSDTWLWTPGTDTWERKAPTGTTVPSGSLPNAANSFAQFDPTTNKVVVGTQVCVTFYDPVANTYNKTGTCTTLATSWNGVIVPTLNRLYAFGSWHGGYFNLATNAYTALTKTSGCAPLFQGWPGLAWDPVQGKIIAWMGGPQVYTLDPATNTCTMQHIPGDPGYSDDVGNYSIGKRFQYAPTLNAFIAFTETNREAYALKLFTTPILAPSSLTVHGQVRFEGQIK